MWFQYISLICLSYMNLVHVVLSMLSWYTKYTDMHLLSVLHSMSFKMMLINAGMKYSKIHFIWSLSNLSHLTSRSIQHNFPINQSTCLSISTPVYTSFYCSSSHEVFLQCLLWILWFWTIIWGVVACLYER